MTIPRSSALLFGALLLVAAGPSKSPAPPPATVVLLVRHAEKAPGSGDVPLSPEGEARARALAALARDAGVQAVITTQFQRTKQTAAPLAQAAGLLPEVIASQGDIPAHVRLVADAIRQRHAGRTVLVVGHSNTVPPIVNALGGGAHRDLCDAEYDALFVVVLGEEGPPRTVKTRYGVPTPVDAGCTSMR